MVELYLPSVPSIVGGNVVVSGEAWSMLIRYIDTITSTINAQADAIVKLSNALEGTKKDVQDIAKAVGGLYNA